MRDIQQTTIELDDIELHYRTRGAGPDLILLHGFTGSGDDFQHLFDLDELAERYRFLIPDLRGHGRSTNPAGRFTHRQCAADVAALLDALGVETCRALGISMGGNTLLHLTRDRPGLVQSQVVVSATPHFPEQARRLMREAASREPSLDELAAARKVHVRGDPQLAALREQHRVFAESNDDMNLSGDCLGAISARTLVVNGDRDPLYPVELSLQMYRQIRESQLWILPNAGHAPVFGEWREEFVRRALAFWS